MSRVWLRQFAVVLQHSLKADAADKERLVTPFLFAATVLLLFNFVFGDIPLDQSSALFIGEIYLITLFSLHLSYSRIFGPEQEDRAFDLMVGSTAYGTAWYLAKVVQAVMYGLSVFLPSALFIFLLQAAPHLMAPVFSLPVLVLGFLVMLGLAVLGTLLSAMTLQSSGRDILFPLLYFPLTIPVLLAGTQGSIAFLSASFKTGWSWLGLLAGFDTIYLTLGFLLFTELIGSD